MEVGTRFQQKQTASKPLLFNPTHSRKIKNREQTVTSPPHSLYTAPFTSQTNSTLTTPSLANKDTSSTRFANYLNPRPNRHIAQVRAEKEKAKEGSVGRYEQLERKVKVLRRTVSQNKVIAQSRIEDLEARAQKLKQEYQQKDKQLSSLLRTINHHFP